MKLILTDNDGLVVDQWDIKQDIDLPDLDELTKCLDGAGFYDSTATVTSHPQRLRGQAALQKSIKTSFLTG